MGENGASPSAPGRRQDVKQPPRLSSTVESGSPFRYGGPLSLLECCRCQVAASLSRDCCRASQLVVACACCTNTHCRQWTCVQPYYREVRSGTALFLLPPSPSSPETRASMSLSSCRSACPPAAVSPPDGLPYRGHRCACWQGRVRCR